MSTLRRFCIGAALGLSLLACGPAVAQTNLIRDPGFTPPHTAWGASSATFSGSRAIVPGGGTIQQRPLNNTTVPLSGLHPYFVTVDIKGTGRLVVLLGGTGAGTGSGITHGFTIKAPTYAHFTRTYLYSKTAFIPSSIEVTRSGATGFFSIDHIGLYTSKPTAAPEVDPEAGAPALALTLGGLALMEKRRRVRGRPSDS